MRRDPIGTPITVEVADCKRKHGIEGRRVQAIAPRDRDLPGLPQCRIWIVRVGDEGAVTSAKGDVWTAQFIGKQKIEVRVLVNARGNGRLSDCGIVRR